MLDVKLVYQEVSRATEKYEHFKGTLPAFVKVITSNLESHPNFGVKIISDSDKNFFDVIFIGHTFRFVFSTKIANGLNWVGLIEFFSVDEMTRETTLINSFPYDENYKTNIVYNQENRGLYINEDGGSFHLLLYCLYQGMLRQKM